MSYENAPQTSMLATYCLMCKRPLCDAKSVETGLGPVCRDKIGYTSESETITEEERRTANQLVHKIALSDDANEKVKCIDTLDRIGLAGVAKAIRKAIVVVKITATAGSRYAVKVPYDAFVVEAMRSIPGRRWDNDAKVTLFPTSSKTQLWELLRLYYSGRIGSGPKGLFVI